MKFHSVLTNWYSINKRSLPWRNTKNPYFIWLSEIILQQTQVKQGLPYYERFVSQYPSVFDLANAPEEAVLKLWQGLGYYSRARNLHKAAQYIAEELQGTFPTTYKGLLELKGVGDYTASAIASICYDAPTAVVDGNVYRVLSRYYGINTAINTTKGIKEFKVLAQSLLPDSETGDYNQAIMEFGARQCKPQSPNCEICPLNTSCHALAKQEIALLPVKEKKLKVKKKFFNYMVFLDADKQTYLEQRTKKGIWQQLYQFPLIESPKSIGLKELIATSDFNSMLTDNNYTIELYNSSDIVHKLSHQHLYTKFWIVRKPRLNLQAIATERLHEFPVPALIHNFIEAFDFE